MNLPVIKHEDERRILIEWISDFHIRNCKALIVKEDCELGNHYHKNKVDTFLFLKGAGTFRIGNHSGDLIEGNCYRAGLGVPHTFHLKSGSILLEASTTPYDKEDEIPISK